MGDDKRASGLGPRDRVVYAMVQSLRERGLEGTGLRPLVADADAPWGSLRHYFPGGKDQIVVEALGWAGTFAAEVVTDYLAATRSPTPEGLLRQVCRWWIDDLTERDFARGCPVAAAVVDSAGASDEICGAAHAAYDVWAGAITAGLLSMGRSRKEAAELATLLIAALEGAVVLSRAQRSTQPLTVVERRLRPLFRPAEGRQIGRMS